MATYISQPSFTPHEGDFGPGGVILITIRRTYGIDTDLSFRVAERPRAGQARVVQSIGDVTEMLHLAEDREAAERWLAKAGYNRGRIEVISDEEACAGATDGHAA